MEPRIRVAAILRWEGRILLLRHQKPAGEVWLLPGGGVRVGESLVSALRRELFEETGLFRGGEEIPLEGPVAQDDAVRGHRAFLMRELDAIPLHPPIHRFLQRWQPGDPATYLGEMWAP